jgi:hypothetical protein
LVKKDWSSAAALRIRAAAGNAKTVEDAVRIVAQRLLDGVSIAPTDLERIAEKLRVSAIENEDMPLSGQLRRGQDGFKVVLSSHLSPARRRFTLAHELGHAFFETTGTNCPRVGRELERICDMLAVELLLPRRCFIDAVQSGPSIEELKRVSRQFGTSLAATAFRYSELIAGTFFEVEGETVRWSTGLVRKGNLQFVGTDLRAAVKNALDGQPVVTMPFYVGDALCRLEWMRLGQDRRAVFVLIPTKPQRSGSVERAH